MSVNFVHLAVHSEYAIVNGLVRPGPFAQTCLEQKIPAVAITDPMNLFGLVKFYKKLRKSGTKLIIGSQIWVQETEDPNLITKVNVLAQNEIGLRHLMQLLSRGYQEADRQTLPVIPFAWLTEKSEGLIVLSGGLESYLGHLIQNQSIDLAKVCLKAWQSAFPDRYYLEVSRVGHPGEADYIQHIKKLAIEFDLPMAATNQVMFERKADFDAHEARVSIFEGRILGDPNRPRAYTEEQYLKSPEEMLELFKDIPEAVSNTVEIAKRCSAQMVLDKTVFPEFEVPKGMAVSEFLDHTALSGLNDRLDALYPDPELRASKVDEYVDRLNLELKVIHEMGFDGYFLIVSDFIRWAKSQDIPVGPGRGSGAGSIVAYALNITDLDPLAYELLFERFLNPERVSLPDFDIDFCMDKRDQVIEYVASRYGRQSVSQISTFGTMAAKAVIRDVGRVLGHPYGFVDQLAKLIPFEIGITLEKAMLQEQALKDRYDSEEEVQVLFDLAMKLEGVVRNVGKHAGGVVIAPGDLTQFSPMYYEQKGGNPVTQFDKDDAEAVGLIKFDFLGLRTLTIIHNAVKNVNKKRTRLEQAPVNIDHIPINDKRVYKLLKACETSAIFQLESRGMKDLIRRLQPDHFEEIIALVALFRPGPLQSGMVDDYIERKHGRAKVAYLHPSLEVILKPTYGVILYQEQVMQIAQVLSGYTLGAADMLRRAMGKKKPEEMAKQREIFVQGAVDNNVPPEQANMIFDLIDKFAGYGFNKSHSAAYALISYQTAWLKTHYPDEFMAAVLSSDMNHTDKLVLMVKECRAMRIKVLPPNVQQSYFIFDVCENPSEISYGLGGIKGVGEQAIEDIIQARMTEPFKNLFDFCERLSGSKLNKRTMEALINAGALDDLGANRASLHANLEEALKGADQARTNSLSGQCDLFGETEDVREMVEVADFDLLTRLHAEKSSLGFYLTGHPMQAYRNEISEFVPRTLRDIKSSDKPTVIAGFVMQIRTMQTKRGERMAFVTIEDEHSALEVALFADVYHESRDNLSKDSLVVLEGTATFDDRTQQLRFRATKVHSLDEARLNYAKSLHITVSSFSDAEAAELKDILSSYIDENGVPIQVLCRQGDYEVSLALGESWRVLPTVSCLRDISRSLQSATVRLHYRNSAKISPPMNFSHQEL